MTTREDDFVSCLGNGKTEHELDLEDFYNETEFKEVEIHNIINGGEINMATIGQEAQAYEPPQQTKNIAELEKVSVDLELVDDTYTFTNKKTGLEETVDQKVTEVDGVNYKVPLSVLNQIKAQMEANPNMKFFKVKKEGEELNTRYTVIPLTQ